MVDPARDNETQLERWNRRFDAEGYLFGTSPNRFLASQARRLKPGMRALSLADGEGRNGVWLAERGLKVRSVDFSPVALAKAQQLAAQRGVAIETEEVDLGQWTFPKAAYDLVVGIFFQFAGPAVRARIFHGIEQALAPGGLLLLHGYTPKQLEYRTGGPSEIDQLYTEALLRTSFAKLEILELNEYEAAVAEGSGHVGMSALIDLVARKP
jgi:cyclopropane fatty-acyl-phospholipid synthase-like methyltransferase